MSATRAVLGFAVLAAALHGARAALTLSAPTLTASQTVDGQWVDIVTGNRFLCTESQGQTFSCFTTRPTNGQTIDYFGQMSKSSSPRVYVGGSRNMTSGSPVSQQVGSYRFMISSNGNNITVCSAITVNTITYPASIGKLGYPNPCSTWTRLYAIEGFAFSWSGVIPNMTCVNITEPLDDENCWNDNYFCSINDRGLKWSNNGPIAGMKCTLVEEPSDYSAAAWSNNYICLPTTSTISLEWHADPPYGPAALKTCTQWWEPNESSDQWWTDNFMCY